jgi:CRISPR-associated protein Cas1
VSLLLPPNRSSDTLLTKAALQLDKRKQQQLWRKTIDAKCLNQHLLALHLAPFHPQLGRLEMTALGRSAAKESTSARMFWSIYAQALGKPDFKRHEDGFGLNALLNYGYAVLLSTTLQKLLAVGLDPTFGISHAVRERSTPLAYDIMEPFRPCVDWRVAQWVQMQEDPDDLSITREFRRYVTGFVLETVDYLQIELTIQHCIEGVVRSFRNALLDRSIRAYHPWNPQAQSGLVDRHLRPTVKEPEQRKAATDFRNFLIDDGYMMIQYSVYGRPMVSHARMETHVRRIKQNLPPEGSIRAIFVTQAQWDRSYVLYGKPLKDCIPEAIPDQLQFW